MANERKIPAAPVSFNGVRDVTELARLLERMKDDVYTALAGDTHTTNRDHAWREAVDRQTGDLVRYYLRGGEWVEVSRTARPA